MKKIIAKSAIIAVICVTGFYGFLYAITLIA